MNLASDKRSGNEECPQMNTKWRKWFPHLGFIDETFWGTS